MDFGCYLAMTAGEFSAWEQIDAKPAWMACHYASYGTGLSNLPRMLPQGAMVVVNDRIPPAGHTASLITEQLQQLCREASVEAVLLDLQRPGFSENEALVRAVVEALPCPVGVSSLYAQAVACPVFVSCPPPHVTLAAQLAPWEGRELWLELATETEQAVVTAEGADFSASPIDNIPLAFTDEKLHCRYGTRVLADRAVFTLQRGQQELAALLREAKLLGVSRVIGLYQQLGAAFPGC
jgi:hypothetical protein